MFALPWNVGKRYHSPDYWLVPLLVETSKEDGDEMLEILPTIREAIQRLRSTPIDIQGKSTTHKVFVLEDGKLVAGMNNKIGGQFTYIHPVFNVTKEN